MVFHCEDGASIDQDASEKLVNGRVQSAAEIRERVAEQLVAS